MPFACSCLVSVKERMNRRKWRATGIVGLILLCCLTDATDAMEFKEMNHLPEIPIPQNIFKEQIDRLFFPQIDPRKPDAFFGISLKWKLAMPVLTFTDYTALLQFAYPIKLPFTIYYEFAEERLDSEEENLIRRKREARDIRDERNNFYHSLEPIIDAFKLPPRACILRTICEVAETPFAENFLGESLNTLLRASTAGWTEFPDEDTTFNQYVDAEHHGRTNGYCHHKYADCPVSVFDLLPSDSHKIEEEM